MKKIATCVMFFTCAVTYADELVTVPPTNQLYFYTDLNTSSLYGITGIKPYTIEKIKVLNYGHLTDTDKVGLLDSVKIQTYYNSYESIMSIIPDEEAVRLKDGLNSFIDILGSYSPLENMFFQYQLRGNFNKEDSDLRVFRVVAGFGTDKLLFIAGKDNIKVGPSRYGNLFSGTSLPFYQLRLQSRRPFEFFGLLDFMLMYGYLKESRKDHSNPNLLFTRLNYKPNRSLEVGINRALLFGGEGRPSYRLKDYPKLIYGSEETIGGRFDNDSYLGYDLKINLFFENFDIFQIYYEHNATDVESPLKKGDPKKLHFPLILFKFHDNAQTWGLKIKKEKWYLNSEYTRTAKSMYINHNYPFEGFSYGGFILGYPYGRSIIHIFLTAGKLEKNVDTLFEVGYLKQPNDMRTNLRFEDLYLSVKSVIKYKRNLSVQPFFRIDRLSNPNISSLANQFNIQRDQKFAWFGGISLTYGF